MFAYRSAMNLKRSEHGLSDLIAPSQKHNVLSVLQHSLLYWGRSPILEGVALFIFGHSDSKRCKILEFRDAHLMPTTLSYSPKSLKIPSLCTGDMAMIACSIIISNCCSSSSPCMSPAALLISVIWSCRSICILYRDAGFVPLAERFPMSISTC